MLWIHASSPARYEQSLRTVAEQLKVRGRKKAQSEIFELLWSWLQDERNGKWLIVLDNADDTNFLLQPPTTGDNDSTRRRIDYLPVCDHGSILLTSRSVDEVTKLVEFSELVIVRSMEKEEAVLLLQSKLRRRSDDMDLIVALAELLELIPLALTQAAAYIVQRGSLYSVQQYVEKIRESDHLTTSVLNDSARDHRRDRDATHSIFSTWQISFEHVHRVQRSAAELLSLMSLCDRHAIPESIVRRYGDDASARSILDESEHAGSNCDELGEHSINDFSRDVAMLEGYSFVTITTETRTFEMHRLVQFATKQWLHAQGHLERIRVRLAENMACVFPVSSRKNWVLCRALYPHVRSMVRELPTEDRAKLLWASTLLLASNYASTTGNLVDAQVLALYSITVRAAIFGNQHVETRVSVKELMVAQYEAQKLSTMDEAGADVLRASLRLLSNVDGDTLNAIRELHSTTPSPDRCKDIEKLAVEKIEARAQTLGENHPYTLDSRADLAACYYNWKRWDKAEELQAAVAEAMARVLGEMHPTTLRARGKLGAIYDEQGRLEDAAKLQKDVLEDMFRTMGKEHAETLWIMGKLGTTYYKQGLLIKGEHFISMASKGMENQLGLEHPTTQVFVELYDRLFSGNR